MTAESDITVAELRRLLAEIDRALVGMMDWRAVGVRSAIGGVVELGGDPGVAADWLREFLAQREAPAPAAQPTTSPTDGTGAPKGNPASASERTAGSNAGNLSRADFDAASAISARLNGMVYP